MRDILETRCKNDVRHVHLISASQKCGRIIETLLHYPTARCLVELFLKITFEGRKTSVAETRELLEREPVTENFLHGFKKGWSRPIGQFLKIG